MLESCLIMPLTMLSFAEIADATFVLALDKGVPSTVGSMAVPPPFMMPVNALKESSSYDTSLDMYCKIS